MNDACYCKLMDADGTAGVCTVCFNAMKADKELFEKRWNDTVAERDKALLQNDELKKAMQNALLSLTKNCKCEGCDCDQKHAAEVLEAALTEKREGI